MSDLAREWAEDVEIPFTDFRLRGELIIPPKAIGIVLFAHGSGSSRHSPRNQFVASILRSRRVATLLFDLLTEQEEREDRIGGHLRFDIGLLAKRLLGAGNWVQKRNADLALGFFGSSTGAAAALVATAQSNLPVRAIVSRGGRPDLANVALPQIKAPTLLIVGSEDTVVIPLNQKAFALLNCPKELRLIEGATHLFEEPGALEQVAEMAADWFRQHFENS
jgi:predicted alpha/beta-hydrolase family hydrolase